MRPVRRRSAPKYFANEIRKKGLVHARALKRRYPKGGVPEREYKGKAYWRRCLDDLEVAFGGVCAYACIRIHPVTGARTVDHFIPKSRDPLRAYSWSNYRYASLRMNTRKGEHDVCDPFRVQRRWFRMNLVTGTLTPAPSLPKATRDLIHATIKHLGLNRDVKDARLEYLNRFLSRKSKTAWEELERECPLVAEEYARQRGRPY